MGLNRYCTTIILVVLSMFSFLFSTGSYAQGWMREMYGEEISSADKNLFTIREKAKEYFKYAEKEYFARYFKLDDNPELQYSNTRHYIAYKRWEEYWLNHVTKDGMPVSPIEEFNEYEKFINSHAKGEVANWININRTEAPGGYWGMGRIREIAFHPTEPNTFWIGADQGGIWKSEDNGVTYSPIGDNLPFLRVSSICVDHTNPDIIYMAGGGIGIGYWQRAIGVYKTIDGGKTWEPTGLSANLWDRKYIRRLAINPVNPNILIASTNEGAFRTDDGGTSWTMVYSGSVWDILFHPDGTTVFIGIGPDIFRSADSGISWNNITETGVSGTFKHLTISPVNSNYLAAGLAGDKIVSIYVSTDKGVTWKNQSVVTDDSNATIGFSSTDPETLYRGWTLIYKSTDLGLTWIQETKWHINHPKNLPVVHADFFRIEKNPHKPDTLYFCNDGGLYIYDEANDVWTERSAGLIISQYYSLSSSQSNETVLLCGSQDNGGWYRKSDGSWRTTNGGDGMHTWQDPDDINYGYSSYPGGKIYRTTSGWNYYESLYNNIYPTPEDGDWNSRFAVDPSNTDRIVTGCFEDVYESVDQGDTWTKISSNLTGGSNLHTIAIPDANPETIYTSTGPFFYLTNNGGTKWITSPVPGSNTIRGIAVSDYDPDLVWVVTSGYTNGSKVFRSVNGGRTWINISGSLPNIPALSIIHEKGTTESLYVGMTYGIYYRNADMDDWEFYGHDIPNTEIRYLDIQYNTNKIRCATYGRGLFEADLYPLSGTRPTAGYSVNRTTVCLGESIQFENQSSDATSYIWNFGDGDFTYASDPEHKFLEPGTYIVRLTAFNDQFTSTFSGEKEITVKPFLEPVKLGPGNIAIGAGNYYHGHEAGLIFNVHFPSKLLSVKVYSGTSERKTFRILDYAGNEIYHVLVNIKRGENIINFNTDLPVGKDFVILATDPEDLFFNVSGAKYPYGKYMVSITGNTEFSRDHYYFFYDWEVQYLSCDYSELPDIQDGDNIATDNIIIYPNPVREQFKILVKGFGIEEDISVRIINMDGTVVYSENLQTARELLLNARQLGETSGAYIIEVRGLRQVYSKRILRVK